MVQCMVGASNGKLVKLIILYYLTLSGPYAGFLKGGFKFDMVGDLKCGGLGA